MLRLPPTSKCIRHLPCQSTRTNFRAGRLCNYISQPLTLLKAIYSSPLPFVPRLAKPRGRSSLLQLHACTFSSSQHDPSIVYFSWLVSPDRMSAQAGTVVFLDS
ncbi:hypothetical protein AB1N83_006641 [Pleurotus pulmonarius]